MEHSLPSTRTTRQRIRETATRLFSTQGFAGTSTRALCEAAGVTKPVLYHYFETKEELFRDIVHSSLDEYLESMARAGAIKASAEDRMVEVIINDFNITTRDPDMLRLLYRVVFATEPVVNAEKVVASAEQEVHVLTDIAADGVRAGEFAGNPEEIAVSVLAMKQIYQLGFLVKCVDYPPDGEVSLSREQARRCVEIALRGATRSRALPESQAK